MALYDYKCSNEKCKNNTEIKQIVMSMIDYSEDKLPVCEVCGSKGQRVYNSTAMKTLEGYRK
jgi:predicted nucleic acid-binding Zn ribbon protein